MSHDTLSPTIRELAATFWHAYRAHHANLARGDISDEEMDATGNPEMEALKALVMATPETLADLAEIARALYRETVWLPGHSPRPFGPEFPWEDTTIPKLFEHIERVTGRLVCDDNEPTAVAFLSPVLGDPPSPDGQGRIFALGQRLGALAKIKDDGQHREMDARKAGRPDMAALYNHWHWHAEYECERIVAEIKSTTATTPEEALIAVTLAQSRVDVFDACERDNDDYLVQLQDVYDTMTRLLDSAAAGLRRGLGLHPRQLGLAHYSL